MSPLRHLILAALAANTLIAQDGDPTRPSARMQAALMAKGSSIPALVVKGVVVGRGKKGVVLLEAPGQVTAVARPGMPFSLVLDGAPYALVVKSIGENGVEIENSATKQAAVLPIYGSLDDSASMRPDAGIAYLELADARLMDALRMIAEQSGNNYSASSTANKTIVSAFLRHVSADNAVEEICKSHNLWFKKDDVSGITRIMDVKEFEKDLVGFREEQTEVFTLLYPNAVDVAIAIADLFGDRVELSLGNEDLNEDARDLQSRFNRFNILGQGNLTASAYQNSSNSTTGSGTSVVNGGQSFGFGGGLGGGIGGAMGGALGGGAFGGTSNIADRYRNRNSTRRNADGTMQTDEERFSGLTPGQAQRVQEAIDRIQTGMEPATDLSALSSKSPTIFVTASRRNNMIVVRTADAKIMEDIRSLVRRMDVPTPLVLLEVKVLRVTLGNGFESAFDYSFMDGRVGGTFTSGAINPSVRYDPITGDPADVVPIPGEGSSGLRDGSLIFQYLGNSVRARLQLLESNNRINTVASPTLLTAHNEVSRLFLGEERPLVRNISSQTILTDNNAASTPNTQIEFRSVGTTLLITPNINSDRTVTLRLLQENSAINRNAASIPVVTNNGGVINNNTVTNVPVDTVASRSVSGTFAAKDGMAVVVGGLIEDQDDDQRAGVPVASKIPVLGLLFRRQNTQKGKSEMIVIVRPHILSTPADGQKLSEGLLRDLSGQARQRLEEGGFLAPQAVPVADDASAKSTLDWSPAPAASAPPAPQEKPARRFFWQKK